MEADCFVIDYKMPAMGGIDLASSLRNQRPDTPIILITGYPDQNIEEKAAAASAASGRPSRKARPPGDKRSGGTSGKLLRVLSLRYRAKLSASITRVGFGHPPQRR